MQSTPADDNSGKSEWKIRLETIQGLIKEDPSVAIASVSNVFPQSLRDSNLLCLSAALQLLERIKDEPELHSWPVFYEIISLLIYPCCVHAKSNIRTVSMGLLLDFERRSHDIVMGVVTGAIQNSNPTQAKAALIALTELIKQQIEYSAVRGKQLDFTDVIFLLIQTLQAKEPEVRRASQEAIAQVLTLDSKDTHDLLETLESELPKAHFQALLGVITDKAKEGEQSSGVGGQRGAKKGSLGARQGKADAKPENPSAALAQSSADGSSTAVQEYYFPAIDPGWENVLQNTSSKWEERCNVLKQIYDDLANHPQPKVPPTSSWSNLTKVVKYVVDNESNNACCIQAIRLQGLMASTIEAFPPQLAKQFFQSLIGKLKEKKPAIVSHCNKSMMSLLVNKLTLTEAMTDVLAALGSKSPDQRQEMLTFLKHCYGFSTEVVAAANAASFLEDSFEGLSYYLRASGLNIKNKDHLQSFIDSFKSRIMLTTKALGALCKASMGLVCDASQGIRNACTEMLSVCCIHHIPSPQHLQTLSDALFQPMIGYQKSAPVSTIMAEIMRFNALSTGGSSTEMQRLKSVVLSIQAAVNSGLIPNVDLPTATATAATPVSTTARTRSPGLTPGIRRTPSRPGSSELADRRSPQAQASRNRQTATPTNKQRVVGGTPAVPAVPAVPTLGGSAAGATPISVKPPQSIHRIPELLLNPLDVISESLILADFLAKPYRLSSLLIDLTNTLLLAGPESVCPLNLQEFIDGLFVTACELFKNFDINLLQLNTVAINHFLSLVCDFASKCTIQDILTFFHSKGTACNSVYVLKISPHSSGTAEGLTYRMIQGTFVQLFEFFCRYCVLLFSLPFSSSNPFSNSGLLPPDLFAKIAKTLEVLLTSFFTPSLPGLTKNSIDTIAPVLVRIVLLLNPSANDHPARANNDDYTETFTVISNSIFTLFVRLSQEPRHVFNLASSEVLLLSDPESLQVPVNIVELSNCIRSICSEMSNKNVPLFPSVNQSASISWCLTTTIDFLRMYEHDERALDSLQSLFRTFLLVLQKDVPFTVLSAQLSYSCPPTVQSTIISMMPFHDVDTKLSKIIAQLSVSEEEISKSTEPVITAMKLLINHVRDHKELLHSSLCRLLVQLVVRILRIHRDHAIGVVQPCIGASLGASLSKSAISALNTSVNEHAGSKLVYRLVRYAAIVLLECVESHGCSKFLSSHDTATILVEIGYFCNKSLIQGLFVDETEELITDVIELYIGIMMSLLANGNIETLAKANMSLLLEVYVTLMSFTCDYFVARHGNDAEDLNAEITAMPALVFRFIPENLAQHGSYLLHLQNEVLAKMFIPITDSLQGQINPDRKESQGDASGPFTTQLDPVKFLHMLATCFDAACDHVLTYLQLEHGVSPENVFYLLNPDANKVFIDMYHRSYELYGVDSKDVRLCLRFVKSMTETYVKSAIGTGILDQLEIIPPYYEIFLTSLGYPGAVYSSSRNSDNSPISLQDSASYSEDRSKDNATPSVQAARLIGPPPLHNDIAHHAAAEVANYMNSAITANESAGTSISRHKSKIPGFESGPNRVEKERLVTAPAGFSRTAKQVSLKANLSLLQTSPKEAITQIHEYALRDAGLDSKATGIEEEGEFTAYLEGSLAPLLLTSYNMEESSVTKLLVSLKKQHSIWLAENKINVTRTARLSKTGRIKGSTTDTPGHSQHAYMDYLNALEAELNKNAK